MPSSRHAKMMRSATSPRFAIKIFLNIQHCSVGVSLHPQASCPDREEAFAVLHWLPVLDIDVDDLSLVLGVDLIHQFHRFNDAEHLPLFHDGSDFHKRGTLGFGRSVEGSDNW